MLKQLLDKLFKKSSSEVKISCLGGAGEIGMNLYIYETEKSAVIVDYGIMFADWSMPGIDSIYPDPAYLLGIKDKITAVIFTHGHEDHIGGVQALCEHFSVPVYTGKFTAELLRHKAERAAISIDIHEVHDKQVIEAGDFMVDFISVPHSIPDTFALRLTYKHFSAIHASDFRVEGEIKHIISRFTEKPLTCLLIDSTNADATVKPAGFAANKVNKSEAEVYNELVTLFREAKGKIFLTTFASNVRRLASAIEAAKAVGRKIVIEGAAMERTIGIASRLGLVTLAESDMIPASKARKEDPSSLVYLVGGCQGEYTSALHSIAMGERKAIHMGADDLLIFSSRNIPGNESSINAMINSAMRRNVNVIQAKNRLVHISGHITPAELKELIAGTCPSWFIPIHGEYLHLRANARLAQEAGIARERCLMMESGTQLVFEGDEFKEQCSIPYGRIYADNSGGFFLDDQGLFLRRQIAHNGVVVILMKGNQLSDLIIKTYGFDLDPRHERDIIAAVKMQEAEDSLETTEINNAELVKKAVKRFFRKHMDRRPLIDIVEI